MKDLKEKMKIEIWSDIACPYCYIGKRKLEQALMLDPNKDEIELEWHSYELNPSLPKQPIGKSYYAYFAEQFNTSEAVERDRLKMLIDQAKEVGLDFDFDKLVVTNTSDALRLVKLAKEYDVADEAEELLFKAYFVDGKCISDRTFLVELAKQLGIPQNKLDEMIDSDKYIKDMAHDMEYSETVLNLEYIPFYWLNKKIIIQGSLETAHYSDILKEAFNDWKGHGISSQKGDIVSGQSCSIDGVCS